MMLSRRDLLKLLAGVPAMALIPPAHATAAPLKRAIPKTGELLHAVGLGTWQTFDVGGDAGGRAGDLRDARGADAHAARLDLRQAPRQGRAPADDLFFPARVSSGM